MRVARWLVLALVCSVLSGPARGAYGTSDPAAEAAVAQALRLEDLWTAETPPLRVRGEVDVTAKGDMAHGNYAVDFVTLDRAREELRFGNYERIRVRTANGYWQMTGLSYQPEIIFQVDMLLRLRALLTVEPKQFLGRLKERRKDGTDEQCTEVRWEKGTARVLCFDKASGLVTTVEYPTGENQNSPEISRIRYADFAPVGDKRIPRDIQAWRDRKLIAQVKITQVMEVKNPSDWDARLFERPTKGEFWAECGPHREELATRAVPVYPAKSRANRENGRVVLYAVIEADGAPSHLTIIHHASLELEAAAVQAVQQWRYKPITCGDTSVRREIAIPVDFWIQR